MLNICINNIPLKNIFAGYRKNNKVCDNEYKSHNKVIVFDIDDIHFTTNKRYSNRGIFSEFKSKLKILNNLMIKL